MRPLVLLGIVFIAVGCMFLYNGGHYTTRKKLLEVGDVKVTTADERTLPGWVPGLIVFTGAALVLIGAQRGDRS